MDNGWQSSAGAWIADMGDPVSLVKGNDTSSPHQRGHLGNNLFRFWNIYQNQAGRSQIERFSRQSCIGGVPLANLHVVDSTLRKKFSSSRARYSPKVRTLIARPARPLVVRKRWP